jgi:hypothetical protein
MELLALVVEPTPTSSHPLIDLDRLPLAVDLERIDLIHYVRLLSHACYPARHNRQTLLLSD